MTEEENFARVSLLTDKGFAKYLFVVRHWFEQVSSITVITTEQCLKYVQSTTSKKKSSEYH